MRRLALVVLVLGSVALGSLGLAARAQAQSVDPGRRPAVSETDAAALLAVAGARARVRLGEDGAVRLLYGAHVAPWSGDPVRDAQAFTQRFGEALGVPQGAVLRPEAPQTWHGFTIVRLRRVVDGRPVIGAMVVVRFLADGAIDLVMSDAGPAHVLSGGSIDAARASEVARTIATGWTIAETTAPSAVAMQVAEAIVPLWAIDLHGASLSQRVRALLDARDGRVLVVMPLGHDAMGRVFDTNPTTTMGVTSDVELADLTSGERLTGRNFRVASCNAQESGECAAAQRAIADAEGNFLYDPDARAFDDGFAEVNAYHHLSRAAAYHRDTHGFTWTCGGSEVMNVLVNYTERPMTAYDNAAFYPSSGGSCGFLIFGQGGSSDYAYDGDVVYHELGHAVTDQVAAITGFLADPLGVHYEPLAVNEGTSDYWAGTLQGDGDIAESFSGLGGMGSHGSLRVIENDLTCPGSLFGEGHYDGRIWAGTAWELRQTLGAEVVDPLVFTTIASITEDPSLADAGDLMIATAMGMEAMGALSAAEVETVRSVVTARGLPMCQRVVPLDDGALREGWSGSEYQTGGLGRSIAPVHYRIDVPADARSLTLDVGRLTFTGEYAVHVRVLGPVRVNIARVTSDIRVPTSGEVRFDADSELPLPRCQTMYVAIESTDLSTRGQSVYTIQAELERTGSPDATCPEPEPDAGAATPDAGVLDTDAGVAASASPGCTCRAGSPTNDGPTAMFALLAVASALVVRRRR